MSDFYTSAFLHKGRIYLRGIKDGEPYKRIVKYKPYLFINGHGDSKYKTIHDEPVHRLDFESIPEAREYIKSYSDVENHTIYGLDQFVYPFIFDNYPGEMKYDPSQISIVSLDIETKMGREGIIESVRTTPNEITAITLTKNKQIVSFGCKDFKPHQDNVNYIKCKDEIDLLTKFLMVWNSNKFAPDVITGWFVEGFDIPYLVGRISKLLGEEKSKELSPWGLISSKETEIKGQKTQIYTLEGITVLDYIDLYKNFTYTARESYTLGYISSFELGVSKLDYSEYTNLDDMYERNFQKYLEYNIRDAELVLMLEDKMKLIELVFAITYDAKVNYKDALTTVRLWDVIIHNYLLEQNIVIPPSKRSVSSEIAGGYVMDPIPGMYKWAVSFDLNALYPHLIQHYNISPEAFEKIIIVPEIDDIVQNKTKVEHKEYSVTANGCCFKKNKKGFLAALSEDIYAYRSKYKKQMLEVKKIKEETKDESLENEITRLDKLQYAKKIQANGLYGALANPYFRWNRREFAEAITLSGQLAIKWVSKDLNDYLNKILKTNKDYLIANDTDSSYLNLDDLVQKFMPNETDPKKITKFLVEVSEQKLQKVIDDSFQALKDHMNAFQQRLFMKLEKVSEKAIWVAKKRYILNVFYDEGVFYDEPELKVTGIEAVRSSTPSSCREAIKDGLRVIMAKTESDMQDYIQDFKVKFKNMSFEEIAFPRGVTNVSQYMIGGSDKYEVQKGTPIHVKGSLLYNHIVNKKNLTYEKIGNGDKIKFCYLKQPNPYGLNVIAAPDELPKEFGLEEYLDKEMQFEKAFLQPMSTIMGCIGWSPEKKNNLSGFFR